MNFFNFPLSALEFQIDSKYRTGVISTRSWIVPAPLVNNFNLLSKMASKNPQKISTRGY